MKYWVYSLLLFISQLYITGCRKQWLDAKSDRSQVIPSTLSDLQAILDHDVNMNGSITSGGGTTPSLGEMACDDYYLPYSIYVTRPEIERNTYIWAKEVYGGAPVNDWNFVYRSVFQANVVLDAVNKIEKNNSNAEAWNNCKGSALFFRAIGFFNIAQVFAVPYDKTTADTDLGIPLRLDASVTTVSYRSTQKETYQRIIEDLETALPLLPDQPNFRTRPSKAAAYALLARVYLVMGEYSNALLSSEKCLAIQSDLMDYNTLNGSIAFPFPLFNNEVIFYNRLISYTILNTPRWKVDSLLYQSYHNNDRRKSLFFKTETDGTFTFRGDYTGAAIHFGGLATDEVYLIKAECLARLGQLSESLGVINHLLQHRYMTGAFPPYGTSDENNALKIALDERRKELVLRGLRWADLRRLNKEPAFAITITRVLDGVEYSLPPGHSRYAFAIPDEVITLTGMQQNER